MHVDIAYAEPRHQIWVRLDIPEGSTIESAIRLSGLLERFPEIDLTKHKVGIFGKVAKLDTQLSAGERVEIYRPITADPETVPRRADEKA